jgi:hypothetical protein
MSLIEECCKLREAAREQYYAEIINELKEQIIKRPFVGYYHLYVSPESEDTVMERLVNDGFYVKEFDAISPMNDIAVRLQVSIPTKF